MSAELVTFRPWAAHRVADMRSAVARGPVNGGAKLPCPGVMNLAGEDGDAMLLARCDRCGFEMGVPSRSVRVVQERDNDDVGEVWWQR